MATQPEKIVKDQSNNLYLKNLSDEVDEHLLTYVFSNFGIVTNAEVMREHGLSKGFGFVCFSSPDEAAKAITGMNSKIFCGKPLYIDLAQKKEDKAAMMVQNAPVAAIQDVQQMPAPAATPQDTLGITSAILFNSTPEEQMEMIGERKYEQVNAIYPDIAGKTTGMLLDIDQGELLHMLMNPEALRRVEEAIAVLEARKLQIEARPQMEAQQQGQQRGQHIHAHGPFINGRGNLQNNQYANQQAASFYQGKFQQRGQQHPRGKHSKQGHSRQNNKTVPVASHVVNAPVAAAQVVQQMPAPAAAPQDILGMTSAMLFNSTPEEQREMIGNRIYLQVQEIYPDIAGKITGMLLDIDQGELLHMLVNPEALKFKVEEAVAVLEANQIQKRDA